MDWHWTVSGTEGGCRTSETLCEIVVGVVGIKDGVYLIHEQMICHLLAGILTFQVVASHKG